MTPREMVAGLLGLTGGILINMLFHKPDLCRRACCMTHQARTARQEARDRQEREERRGRSRW